MGWDDLAGVWVRIEARDTAGFRAGEAFETLVLRAFELDGAEVTWPFEVAGGRGALEQLDGALYLDGWAFLVESKDYSAPVNVAPIAKLRAQLARRPPATMGLVFAYAGFTESATTLAASTPPNSVLLWTGREIGAAVRSRGIAARLRRKLRYCVEHGIPVFDTSIEEGR
jgi:hypothetical protein